VTYWYARALHSQLSLVAPCIPPNRRRNVELVNSTSTIAKSHNHNQVAMAGAFDDADSPDRSLAGRARAISGAVGDRFQRFMSKDEKTALLKKKVQEKDDFERKRKRCITNPDRAYETLGPYAQLELVIQCGRDLTPRDSWTGSITLDPAVHVYVDDVKLTKKHQRTMVVRGTTAPLWQHKMVIDIVSPMSMVRLQVIDDQVSTKIDQCFVEFCVGDIPYNKMLAGWLELRHQDLLKNNSLVRYSSHCAMREDELGIAKEDAGALATKASNSKVKSNVSSVISPLDLKQRRVIGERALLKTRTMMHSCGHSCTRSSTPAQALDPDRGNAGEIFVHMRLRKCVSEQSSLFALAVDPPAPKSYGDYVIQEEVEEGKVRQRLDLQRGMDLLTEMKIRLGEDFGFCLFYYFWYIASWRSVAISLPLTILLGSITIHFYWWTIVWPGILAVLLILNSCEGLRKQMTRGGWNAMFSDEGLRLVAQWRKTEEMFKYFKRVVEQDLGGTVTDPSRLRSWSSEVARDGVPLCSYADLVGMLRSDKECVSFELTQKGEISAGDKVLVDERLLASVAKRNGHEVWVVYDEHHYVPASQAAKPATTGPAAGKADSNKAGKPPGAAGSPTAASANASSSSPTAASSAKGDELQLQSVHKSIKVDISRVRRRQVVHFYQTWLLPSSIQSNIMDIMGQVDKLKDSQLLPLLDTLTDIVCWKKRKFISIGIVVALSILFVLILKTELIYQHDQAENGNSDNVDEWQEAVAWGVISLMRNIDNLVYFGIFFATMVLPAKWFVSVLSVFKIAGRASAKRAAPELWSFFHEDPAFAQSLEDLMPSSNWEADAASSTSRSWGGPDLKKIQQMLSKNKGLSFYKVPDPTHPSNLPSAAESPKE